jgi:hypothetical protein
MVYQKQKKKVGIAFKKIADDVITQKWMTSRAMRNKN